MDYRQAIGYQDRTEYLAQFNAELCYVQAVEKLANLEPPERALYIRVILAELNRISSHFMFLGAFGTDLGVFGTSFTYAFREREYLLDLFEEVSGDRLMYAYFRPGGVAWDVPGDFKDHVRGLCKRILKYGYPDMDRLLTDNELFIARTRGHRQALDSKTRSTTAPPGPSCARPASSSTCARTSPTASTTASTSTSPSGPTATATTVTW